MKAEDLMQLHLSSSKGFKKHHLDEAWSKPVRERIGAKETKAVEKMQLIINLPDIPNKLRKPQMLLYCL